MSRKEFFKQQFFEKIPFSKFVSFSVIKTICNSLISLSERKGGNHWNKFFFNYLEKEQVAIYSVLPLFWIARWRKSLWKSKSRHFFLLFPFISNFVKLFPFFDKLSWVWKENSNNLIKNLSAKEWVNCFFFWIIRISFFFQIEENLNWLIETKVEEIFKFIKNWFRFQKFNNEDALSKWCFSVQALFQYCQKLVVRVKTNIFHISKKEK